jgi:hypothetical protein
MNDWILVYVEIGFANQSDDAVWHVEVWCESKKALRETIKKGFESGCLELHVKYDDGDFKLTFFNTSELEFVRFEE